VKIRVLQTAHGSAATVGGGLPRDVGRRSSKRLRRGRASSGGGGAGAHGNGGAGGRVCNGGGGMYFGCVVQVRAPGHTRFFWIGICLSMTAEIRQT
jgi:hypothetical protein